MRFIVFGAGAIGGVVGGRLAEHGYDVILIARGAHYDAIRARGLRIESPDRSDTITVTAVDHPARIEWRPGDVVLLAVKTQDAAPALRDLAAVAPPEVPVVCLLNGVESERLALRCFANVYAVCVVCPTTHLTPGVVQAWSAPTTGTLDLGRYPTGVDATAEAIAAAFCAATFSAQARPHIMRWKYGKLLSNLGNAVEALCGAAARQSPLAALARREGLACFAAAGIACISDEEDAARRTLLRLRPIAGQKRLGGSSWQSLQRGAHSIESDYLNGEIVLLGRLHGVPTPVNALLQRLANDAARAGRPPGTMSPDEILALLP